jgi:uncharacterized phiE125 gp8 family phage protein
MPIYSTEVVTPPADDPVTAEELWDHLSLNIALADVEDLLVRNIQTATEAFIFHSGGRVPVATVYDQFSPGWGRQCRPLQLVQGKASTVSSVKYYDADDELQTLDADEYGTDLTGTVGLIWMKDGATWPTFSAFRPRPVVVRYTAGWASANAVPADVKTGILLLAAHLYRYRGDEEAPMPDGFVRLANKYHTGIQFA